MSLAVAVDNDQDDGTTNSLQPLQEESSYSVMTETQERLLIFDTYITGMVGITLAICILFSLSNTTKTKLYANNKYYRYSIICGIVASIFAIGWYMIKVIGNDLLFPINLTDNLATTSLLDSFSMMIWVIEKIACYFGFAFVYLSLYQKDKMDPLLIGMMVGIAVINIVCVTWFTIADALTLSDDEITVGSKRGIFVVTVIDAQVPDNYAIMSLIAVIGDLVYVLFLIIRFYRNGTAKGDSNGTKCIILLIIASIAYAIMWISNDFDSDLKWMVDSVPTFADNICLFLMYSANQGVYNKLCGCCCVGLGSKYKPIDLEEVDGDGVDDDEVAALDQENP